MRFLLTLIVAFAAASFCAAAQGDTLRAVDTARAGDTLRVRAGADSIAARADSADEGVDSVVYYKASDTIRYRVDERLMRLVGNAEATYEGQKLTSGVIEVDFNANTLSAEGAGDSAAKSSLGTPVFDDKGAEYRGNRLVYNFKTKRGNIAMSTSKLDNGYYYADKVYRETEQTYFVKNGRYTTCDDPHPHYYFASPKMKVELGREVLAAPVYLYIADVPLFAVPFAVFPNHGGRQSGLIAPAYGQSSARGFFLQHLGYYVAASDYWDIAMSTDLYTKGSAVVRGDLQYALRYNFTGGIHASLARTRDQPDDPIATNWSLQINHNQTIDPRTSLVANLHFLSSTYVQTTATNLNDLLNRSIQSDASFSRSWDNSSLSLTYARRQDLLVTDITQNARLGFTLQQFAPFRSKATAPGSEEWYELLTLAYSGSAVAAHAFVDHDSVHTNELKSAVIHTPSISFTPKLGVVSVTPFVSYNEVWYPERIVRSVDSTDTVRTATEHGFNRVWWYSAGLGVSTRLYGLAYPRLFGVTAFRHTLTPSVRFTWSPDFADPKYGYYGSYMKDTVNVQYSHFEGGLGGFPSAGRQMALGVQLDNAFEMKVKTSDTSETNVNLLTAGIGASYNFAATSFRMSDVTINARTSLLGVLDLGASATVSLYATDTSVAGTDKRIDKYRWQMGQGIANITSSSFSLSTTLSFMQSTPVTKHDSTQPKYFSGEAAALDADALSWERFLGESGEGNDPFRLPMSLRLGFNFSQQQPYPEAAVTRAVSLSADLSMRIGATWSLSTSGFYDIAAHQLNAPAVRISKDLHCWEMNFIWYPSGYLRGFTFELRVKAPQLQDIKLTKRSNDRGLY